MITRRLIRVYTARLGMSVTILRIIIVIFWIIILWLLVDIDRPQLLQYYHLCLLDYCEWDSADNDSWYYIIGLACSLTARLHVHVSSIFFNEVRPPWTVMKRPDKTDSPIFVSLYVICVSKGNVYRFIFDFTTAGVKGHAAAVKSYPYFVSVQVCFFLFFCLFCFVFLAVVVAVAAIVVVAAVVVVCLFVLLLLLLLLLFYYFP